MKLNIFSPFYRITLKNPNYLFLGSVFLFCIFIYFDPTATWIEISKVFSPGEGRELSYDPLKHVFISKEIALLFFLNCILTMIVGFTLTVKLWRRVAASFLTKLFASFIPGYLATCAIARIVTIFFSHKYAPSLIVFFEILLIFIFARFHKDRLLLFKKPLSYKTFLFQIILASILFLLSFTEGIQWGYHFLTGDGTGFFLNYLNSILPALNRQSYLPLVDQHADELLFNYSVLFTFNKIQNPQILFWFLNVVGRFSAFYLIYLLFRYYRLNRIYSSIATLFLFFGTTAINPTKYLLLFDGVNPLFYVLNIQRSIAAIMPFLWFALLEGTRNRKGIFTTSLPLMLMTIGTLMTSIHNSIAMIVTTLVWLIYPCIKVAPLSIDQYKRSQLGFLLIGVAPVVTYALISTVFVGFQGLLLLLACFLCAGLVFQLADWRHQKFTHNNRLCIVLNIFMAFFIASLTLGNVITVLFRKLIVSLNLDNIFHFEPILSRAMIEMNNPLYFFHFVGCDSPTAHCKSGIAFFGYYGLMLILSYLAFLTIINAVPTKNTRLSHRLMFQLVLSLGFFVGALMIKDFFDKNTMSQGWLFTRLLEIPYYSILFIFFITSGRYWPTVKQRGILALSVLWCIIPILSTHRIDQWLSNLKFLFNSGFFH